MSNSKDNKTFLRKEAALDLAGCLLFFTLVILVGLVAVAITVGIVKLIFFTSAGFQPWGLLLLFIWVMFGTILGLIVYGES